MSTTSPLQAPPPGSGTVAILQTATPTPAAAPAPGISPSAPAPRKWTGRLKDVVLVLGSVPRWRMLQVLATTEWLPVSHLAKKGGVARSAGSKHVAVLLKAKVIEKGMGRLYRLAPSLRPPPSADYLDFGWCQMKLTPPS